MEKNIETTHHKKINLALLVCLVGFPQLSETIYTPSLTEIANSYSVHLNIAQMTLSIYFAAFAFGVFFWGIGSDYFGRKKAMNLGIFVYVLGCAVCLLSKNIELLFVGRFVQAFGASTGSVTTQTILRDNYSGNERHQLFAKISAALAFSPALGPLIGGFLGEFYGFRAVFSFLLLMGMVLLFWSLKDLPETGSLAKKIDAKKVFSVGRSMLIDRYTLIFGLLIGILNGVLFSYHSEAPTIFIEKFSFTQSQYGFMGVVVAVGTAVGAWLSNRELKRLKPEIIIENGLKLAIAGSLFLVITALLHFSMILQVILYILGIFVLLVGVGMALPNCLSLALVKFADIAGTAGAFLSLGYYIIVSICTFLISILHNGSTLVLPIFCLVLLIMALISIRLVITE